MRKAILALSLMLGTCLTVGAQPTIISPETIAIDPAFWEPEKEQNAVIFSTSATVAFDPRAGEERLFLVTHVVPLATKIDGDHYEASTDPNDLFDMTGPAPSTHKVKLCQEDSLLFIVPTDNIERPVVDVPDGIDAGNTVVTHGCDPPPQGNQPGWHYGPGNLVDYVDPVREVDLAFIAASKSPDANEFTKVVLLISDANAPGVGRTNKFRIWSELELFNVAPHLKDELLIPEVILARTPSKVWNNGTSDVVRWTGFAQVWSCLADCGTPTAQWRVGASPIMVENWIDSGFWAARFWDDGTWVFRNSNSSNPIDFHPTVTFQAFPQDVVFNPLKTRWEAWFTRPVSHGVAQLPTNPDSGDTCALQTRPFQRFDSLLGWVDHQRGFSGVEAIYREIDLTDLSFRSSSVQLGAAPGMRGGPIDYETAYQGASVLFHQGQAYFYTSHRDRNICTLPESVVTDPLDADQDGSTCGYCSTLGTYTTVARMSYDGVPSPGQVIGEVGQRSVSAATATVNLSRSYTNPVVIAQPLAFAGSEPALARITSVSANRFTVKIQEPKGTQPGHVTESLSYLVLEAGRWRLADGTLLEVGQRTTSATVGRIVNNVWSTVGFATSFTTPPVVFSQVQTNNDPHYVATRHSSLTAGSFRVGLEEDEVESTQHGLETIGWVAMEPGGGSWNGLSYLSAKVNGITHAFKTISFPAGSTGSSLKRFLASIAGYAGVDNAHLRYRNLTRFNVELKVEEDMSRDSEMNHAGETVDYLVIEGNGQLTGASQ